MSLKDKTKEFCSYVQTITARPVVLNHSNGPQFNQPFISVNETFEPMSHDTKVMVYDEDEEQMKETVRGLCKVIFQVTCWGGEPTETLNILRNSLWSSIFFDKLENKGFGLSSVGAVIDTSAPFISSNFESRAQVDIQFYLSVPTEFIIDYFDEITLTTKTEEQGYINSVIINSETGVTPQ